MDNKMECTPYEILDKIKASWESGIRVEDIANEHGVTRGCICYVAIVFKFDKDKRKKNRGKFRKRRVLTSKKTIEIIRLMRETELNQTEIAKRVGVSRQNVSIIKIRNKLRFHLTKESIDV